ncbi:unnamed protein product [marine sediment metagenome]|uniref:Uncharacterized protein n=1 Tax=marine sediment metagenome TaxID=412755 RepID=X1TB32_9ZZZZ
MELNQNQTYVLNKLSASLEAHGFTVEKTEQPNRINLSIPKRYKTSIEPFPLYLNIRNHIYE